MKKFLIVAAALAATSAVGFSAQAAELKSKAMTDQQLDQVVAGMSLYLNKSGNYAVAEDGTNPGRTAKNRFTLVADNNSTDSNCAAVEGGSCSFTLLDTSILTFNYVDTDPTEGVHMDWVRQ